MTTKEAIAFFGSQAELAAALGVSSGAVSQWSDEPPDWRQWQIQVLTKNKLRVSERVREKAKARRHA